MDAPNRAARTTNRIPRCLSGWKVGVLQLAHRQPESEALPGSSTFGQRIRRAVVTNKAEPPAFVLLVASEGSVTEPFIRAFTHEQARRLSQRANSPLRASSTQGRRPLTRRSRQTPRSTLERADPAGSVRIRNPS